MSTVLPTADLDSKVGPLLDDLPVDVFGPGFAAICTDLDRYIGALAAELVATLEVPRGRPVSPADAVSSRGWSAAGELAVRWLLETAALFGFAHESNGAWSVEAPIPAVPSRLQLERAAERCPAARPAFDVMARAASELPGVLAGATTGEEALFGMTALGLWFDYFSNDNPLYAPSNRLLAEAAARVTPRPKRILEIGGGGGSAAEAVLVRLAALSAPLERYLFTELQPAFLRRGARAARAAAPEGCTVEALRYDLEKPPEDQGVGQRTFDLVVAVNTFHLASDPVAALARIRPLLAPDGAVILGELIRPEGARGVHLELPFTLLASYREAPLVPGVRPRPGFMTASGWRTAFTRAGFGEPTVLPRRLSACVEAYPGFYSAALTAAPV